MADHADTPGDRYNAPITRKASGPVKLPEGKSERDVFANALVEKYGIEG